jgi:hypothetical protein
MLREELIEFIATANKNTKLTDMVSVCNDMDEVNIVMNWISMLNDDDDDDDDDELSNALKIQAYNEFENVPTYQITVLQLQKKLSIGYGKAYKLLKWLKKVK